MKIAESVIQQETQHLFRQEQVKEERLLVWKGEERPDVERQGPGRGDGLSISAEARRLAGRGLALGRAKGAAACRACPEAEGSEDPQLAAMRLAIEAITGRKITIHKVELQVEGQAAAPAAPPPAESDGPQRLGWGLEYDSFESYSEEESLTYQAAGVLVTEDGRQISFALDMAMSRSFYQASETHIRAGDAKLVDPLVINFAGKAAELNNASFTFDLDADGQEEELAGLAGGSAFLALDKNGDGIINDGTELFGPQSGHGFSELAAYDEDNNGWIDENDPVFSKLLAWIKDQDGNDQLLSVMDLGVGALYLAGMEGDFSLTDADNNTLGKVRETSLFVKENGEVGTIQELDLVI
ncbi:MAG: hypothetical protein C0613_14795 [Desulfobulbaceae bacterium]|nr:MAG: hypothetical protein C0613_14795 [Desulfobulbaceae bacterium]